jgi:hypothetical protein
MCRYTTFSIRRSLVTDPDIGECAAHHDLMIATP